MKPRMLTRLAAVICLLVPAAAPLWADDTPAAKIVLASLEPLVPLDESKPEEVVQKKPVEPMTVIFTDPLPGGGEGVEGQSLETLIKGSPRFAPVEGIPEELWKEKTCSACHQWSRDDLCNQGRRYVGGALQLALTKLHPYGGGFKQAVNDWALSDCR